MSKGYEIPLSIPGASEALSVFDRIIAKLGEVGSASERAQAKAREDRKNSPEARLRSMEVDNRRQDQEWRQMETAQRKKERYEENLKKQEERAFRESEKRRRQENQDPIKTMFMRTRLKIGPWQPLVGDLVKNGLLDENNIDKMMGFLNGSRKSGFGGPGVSAAMKASQGTSSAAAKAATGAAVSAASQAAESPGIIAAVTGIAAAAMPFVIGGAAVAAGGAALYAMANAATEKQRSYSSAYWMGGGDPGQASAVGGFLGMDPGTMAGRANQFADTLRGGGYGAAMIRDKGVIDLGPHTTNKFTNLIKALDELRKMDEKKAINVARSLGISDMMNVYDLSDGTWKALKKSKADRATPAARKEEAEYRAQQELFGSEVEKLMQGVNKVAMWWWTPVLKSLNGTNDPLLPYTMRGGKDSKPEKAKSETKELSDNIQNLTRTLKDEAEMIGGGRRARGALPPGWKHQQLSEQAMSHAQMLGAFSVA